MTIHIGVKGIREGLLVTIDEGTWDAALPALLEHLDARMDFFQGAKVLLRLGDRALHVTELAQLRNLLGDRGIVLKAVLTTIPATVSAAQSLGLETALPKTETRETPLDSSLAGAEAVFLRQTLRSGNSVHFRGHVVVVGDVNPGAEIVASGSVVVWGRLRGTVHAGAQGDESAMVYALDMAPMHLRIAGLIATEPPHRRPHAPETASMRNGTIGIEPWNAKEKNPFGGTPPADNS